MPDESVPRISKTIGDLMRVAGSDRVHAARQAATGVDLSRTEIRFLGVVAEQGPQPVTVLGAVLHLSQPTASRTLGRLEAAGLVRRQVDRRDGRVARYELTRAGVEVRQRFQSHMDAQLDRALAAMPDDRRSQLADLLEELVAAIHRSG